MAKFRKKPVVIEAVQWTGSNAAEIADFMGTSPAFESDTKGNHWVQIQTLESPLTASKGDWIIKGVRGEFYPHKPEFFFDAYEPVED